METSGSGAGSLDERLTNAVVRGEVLDLVGKGPTDGAAMRLWGPDRTISAAIIREIIRGRTGCVPDPHGLRLRGAVIAGRIDLENIVSDIAVMLLDCLLPGGLQLRCARLISLSLEDCRIEHPAGWTGPMIAATQFTARAFSLARSTVTADTCVGAVTLNGAHVGQLDCSGARLRNSSGPSLDADDVHVDQVVQLLGGFAAAGAGNLGAVRLSGARIGQVECDGARLENPSGPALFADGLHVEQALFLRRGFVAIGTSGDGTVRLPGAELGHLDCRGARLESVAGPALNADGMRVARDVLLGGGFAASSTGDRGTISFLGADIGHDLNCDGARLKGTTGPALSADGLQVGQDMSLSDGLSATSIGQHATIRLHGARVGGTVDLTGAQLHAGGSALNLELARIGRDVNLSGGFTAASSGELATVRLAGAHIGGWLDCRTASLRNAAGPALVAEWMQVHDSVLLRDQFTAAGADDRGTVQLAATHIGGALDCRGARLTNTTGPAFSADSVEVGQSIFLNSGFTVDAGDGIALVLTGGRIGGLMWLDLDQVTTSTPAQRVLVKLDGLTYSGLPQSASLAQWRRMLEKHTPGYAAQPYQQLAAAYRAAGHDREVRLILMDQRRDQIRRHVITGWDRAWARITGLTLGFGYQPWRALLLLLAVLCVSVVLTLAVGQAGGLSHTSRAPDPAAACGTLEQIGVGLDLGTPLLKTGARELCAPTARPAGQVLTIAGWTLQILAWAFAALFIGGFTSAVRRT